ncbi:MAG: YkgJ family cysteine cluster protein [Archangium sp.]
MTLSELCLECGLCCDGTLFRHVEISSSERERLVQLGIKVGERRKHDVMWLPCGKLEGRKCTIYEQRPGGCDRFVCALGRKLKANEVGGDEALARVREMQAALDALRALLPPGEGPVLRRARELIDAPQPVTDDLLAAFKRVDTIRYEVFMPPPQPE